MIDDSSIMQWEEDGGACMTVDDTTCRICGSDRGPKIKQMEGWVCLVHFPKIGEVRSWR